MKKLYFAMDKIGKEVLACGVYVSGEHATREMCRIFGKLYRNDEIELYEINGAITPAELSYEGIVNCGTEINKMEYMKRFETEAKPLTEEEAKAKIEECKSE